MIDILIDILNDILNNILNLSAEVKKSDLGLVRRSAKTCVYLAMG